MHKPLLHTLGALAAAAALLAAVPAQAQGLVNGSFESYLTGWSHRGDAAVDDTLVTHGDVGMLLGSASANDIDDPDLGLGPGGANFSGVSAVAVGGSGGLAELLGLAAGRFDNALGVATEGTALTQTIHVGAGDTLHFDWALATVDARLGDYVFAVLGDTLVPLADLRDVVIFDGGIAYSAPATYSHTFTQAASVLLGFGVVDIGDELGTSVLLLDNVRVTAAVPEPGTWALMLGGLALLGRHARRIAGRA